MNNEIAVITVNWNGWRMTLDCLASLRASEGAKWRLYIVDNASTDDSIDHLRDLGDDVTLIRSDVNGGWTGGNNLGVLRALEQGHDFIFLLNNDATVERDTLSRLLTYVQSEEGEAPPVIGPVNRRDDDPSRYDFLGGDVDDRTGMPTHRSGTEADRRALPASYDVAFVNGAGLFLTRRHVEVVGLFDDSFYLNFDDTDWCYRARRAGFPIRLLAAVSIVHAFSGSIGGVWSPLNVYFMTRNSLLFAERHSSWRQRLSHAADLAKQGRSLTFVSGGLRRVLLMIFGTAATQKAFRAGIRDYALRRYGDCPNSIRSLGKTTPAETG